MRNLQEQVKQAFCYQKMFWPFTVWINCSSDLKSFTNSWPSASNFKKFSRSLGQNNFGNKIPFLLAVHWQRNRNKKVASPHCTVGIQYTHLHWNATSRLPRLSSTFFHSVKSLCDCTFYIWSCIYFESNSKVNVDKFHPQSIYYDSKLLAPALLHRFKLFFGHFGKTTDALDFYPNQQVRKQMCQSQRVAKVILSNIYIVILPVSQHVFLLGFFLYACVFDTYQIFECGNQNYYKKLRTYFIFIIMGNFLSILSINSLQLFILRNDDLFIMRQNYKV